MNFNRLKHIRQQVYASFEQGADALFNLADALLSESQAQSLPELSLSPFFERQWSSVYEALEDGRINVEQLRTLWVNVLLEERAETEQRITEPPQQPAEEEHRQRRGEGIHRRRQPAQDDRDDYQRARGEAFVEAGGERIRRETHPAVERQDHADHRPRDPQRRRAHRQHGVEKRVAEQRCRDHECGGERRRLALDRRCGQWGQSAAATAAGARYSASGATE